MTWPTVQVRIATSAPSDAFTLDDVTDGKLDTGTLGDTFGKVWTDVTEYVRTEDGISLNRGATRQAGPYLTFEAGRLTLKLDNRSGDFDPLNLSGPFVSAGVSQLLPGLPISVEATYKGTMFQLFSGYVDTWNVTYPGQANTDSVVDVAATDPTGVLVAANTAKLDVAEGAGDTIADRLNRLLDRVRWSAEDRDIDDSGTASLAGTTFDAATWPEMQSTATSVNGYLWLSVRGTVVFREKSSFPRTHDFMVGDGGMMPVVALELANDWEQVYNVVRLNRPDGNEQTVVDEDSAAKFGFRTFQRTDLVVDSDVQVADSAGYVLSQFRDQQLRLEGVSLEPDNTYSDDAWSTLLGMDILNRLSASVTTTDGRSIERDALVRGIALDIQPFRWNWQVSTMAAPDALGTFTLDDAALGLLDTGTLAAF